VTSGAAPSPREAAPQLALDYRKLTPGQRGTLAGIAAVNKPLYKGYLIKEQIREALKVKGDTGKTLMRGVTAWAHRCRIPEMTSLAPHLIPVPGLHRGDPGRRPLQRPRRSPQRPGQRPDHTRPRISAAPPP
jgi:hypothetical protein